jgi:hypothetical protein
MRTSWIAAVALALVLGLLGGATAGAESPAPGGEEELSVESLGECSTGHACVWPNTLYGGTVGQSLCTGGLHTFGGNLKRSGANMCTGSNKAVWFRSSGTTIQCLNAGESSGAFWTTVNELWVGAENSHC